MGKKEIEAFKRQMLSRRIEEDKVRYEEHYSRAANVAIGIVMFLVLGIILYGLALGLSGK